MRGVRRKLVVALAGVACLLLVVTWVSSYRRHEIVAWITDYRAVIVQTSRGRLSLRHVSLVGGDKSDRSVRFSQARFSHSATGATPLTPAMHERLCDTHWAAGPFSFLRGGQPLGGGNAASKWKLHTDELIVPIWFVAGVVLGTAALLYRLTKPPRPVGHCAKCGYDLRALPERCPKCGAEPSVQVT